MNVLSLFDGMSCGQIALQQAEIGVSNYYASEIDKYAIKVTQENFPKSIQLGDVRNVNASDLSAVDLLIGGSPCQGLSISNVVNRKNLQDERSRLFYEFVRIKNEIKPKYFLLENVEMNDESNREFDKLMGVKSIKLDSRLVSAQRRIRLYWTNIPFDENIVDKGLLFKDILDKKATKPLSDILLSRFRLTHKDDGSRLVIGTTAIKGKIGQRDRVYGINNKIPTLTATDYKQPKQVYVDGLLRRLTPLECERLQNVPDNYTNHVSDTQRYKMLGNGWTVGIVSHILKGIKDNKNK